MSSDRLGASIVLCLAVAAALPLRASAGEAARLAKTWRTMDEVSAEEKKQLDSRAETPRDSRFPYLPAERYPFEPPFTAEEIGIRSADFIHVSRWSHAIYDAFGLLTGGGYLHEAAAVGLVNYVAEPGLAGELFQIAPGDVSTRMLMYYVFPPETDGAEDLYVVHRTDAERTKKIDYFTYAPSLRRVRRQPEPRRGERFPNAVQSFDDIIGRAPWEFAWRFVGADVLYETVRFPNTRATITLANAAREFREVPTGSLKMMGNDYPYYRPDGGVDCWVLEAKTRTDWLPGYPLTKILYWLDRHSFYPLRIEQYDQQGELQVVEVRLARQENPALGERGYAALITIYFDPKLDMTSYSVHDAHTVREWTDQDREVVFSPDFMRRGWLVQPLKSQALVRSPDQFYLRPMLDREKFPNERKVALTPEVQARVAAQEAAGHVVFETQQAASAAASP
ncbi:MAG: DUF1329 domain-containing protein [Deltaproteobacteria bacterium]|nr:DUF1329 domain-containing protein [Deltaproteobacteria bacterium]